MSTRPGSHARSLDTNALIKSLYSYLQHNLEGRTGLEVAQEFHVLNPAGLISELRRSLRPRGLDVECRPSGKTDSGRAINRYVVVPFTVPEVAHVG
jgi:hypothetical protein